MKLPYECNSIEEIRQEIDEIDQSIINLIAKRYSFIQEIIKFKSSTGEVYAKKRYLAVIYDRRKLASDHQLDPDVIENMFRILMDYFIKEQLGLRKNKQK
jgi:isochorismate pyruvate lyase